MKYDSYGTLAGDSLWEKYFRTRSEELRNQIAEKNLEPTRLMLSKIIATKYRYAEFSCDDIDDLTGKGFRSLLLAIENYNPSYKTKFSSLLYDYLRGMIYNYLYRDNKAPSTVSIEDLGGEGEYEIVSPEDCFKQIDDYEAYQYLTRSATPTQKKVLDLMYLSEVSCRKAGLKLGVSQQRSYQIAKSAY